MQHRKSLWFAALAVGAAASCAIPGLLSGQSPAHPVAHAAGGSSQQTSKQPQAAVHTAARAQAPSLTKIEILPTTISILARVPASGLWSRAHSLTATRKS